MAKRPNQSGSVYHEPERNRWVAVAPPPTRRKFTGKTRELAEERLLAYMRLAAVEASGINGHDMTVDQMLDLYLATRARRPASTVSSDVYTAAHLRQLFGPLAAWKLSAAQIKTGLNYKQHNELSAGYVGRLRSQLLAAYNWAIVEGLLEGIPNPVQAIPTPEGVTAVANPRRILTPAEMRGLLDCADAHRLGVVVHLGLWGGLRPAEVRGLTVTDIDLKRRVLTVSGQANSAGERVLPKTRRARRGIRMDQEFADRVADHLDALAAERASIIAQVRWPQSDRLVLSENGTPVDGHNLGRHVERWAAQAGIVGSVAPYDLRATCAQMMMDGGASLEETARFLGHADTRTLQRHYLTRVDDVHEGGAARLRGALRAGAL